MGLALHGRDLGREAGEKESLTCALFRTATDMALGSQWDVVSDLILKTTHVLYREPGA